MRNKVIVLAALLLAGLVVSCGPKSKKGAWIDADKEKFVTDCKAGAKDQSIDGMDQAAFDKFVVDLCDCAVKKAEQNYDNFTAADSDQKGMENIGSECGMEIATKMFENMVPEEPEVIEEVIDTTAAPVE